MYYFWNIKLPTKNNSQNNLNIKNHINKFIQHLCIAKHSFSTTGLHANKTDK